MSAVVLIEKACTKCGETKPASQFSPNRKGRFGLASWCKPCMTESVRQRNTEVRQEMGEERWLAHRSEIMRRSRERRGMKAEREWNRARSRVITQLIERHRDEYDALLQVELYNERSGLK